MSKDVKRINYMGSKAKIVDWVLTNIVNTLEEGEQYHFVDVFGGGGSITTTAVENYPCYFQTVQYNEINTSVYELFTLLTLGTEEDREQFFKQALQWVDRDTFNAHEEMEAGAYRGYVETCWSFGNNTAGYLFGVESEELKRLAHNVVVDFDKDSAAQLPLVLPETFWEEPSWNVRRLILCQTAKKTFNSYPDDVIQFYKEEVKAFPGKRREVRRQEALKFTTWFRTQGVEPTAVNRVTGSNMAGHYSTLASQPAIPTPEMWGLIKPLIKKEIPAFIINLVYNPKPEKEIWLDVYNSLTEENLQELERLHQLEKLQELENLHQLERLQELETNTTLKTTNQDYRHLNASKNMVLYCDAPYKGTAKYKVTNFNHDAYAEWLQEQTRKDIPVFVSEYDLDVPGYEQIAVINKRSLLTSQKSKAQTKQEKLYWNRIK